jgi:hypothetical protein
MAYRKKKFIDELRHKELENYQWIILKQPFD